MIMDVKRRLVGSLSTMSTKPFVLSAAFQLIAVRTSARPARV
jgi:hypothetical protein